MNVDSPVSALPSPRHAVPLPAEIQAALWRADGLGVVVPQTLSTGFEALDAQLPGGGWPTRSLTELLLAQPAALEWRLLAGCLRGIVAAGQTIVLVAPPQQPHLPGLRHAGIEERCLVWIKADAPAQRLWSTEQLIKSASFGALVAWLPQARPEQIRRLQVAAQGCEGPVFLCRPLTARHEASAAPLRLTARVGVDWELQVQVVKRRGSAHESVIALRSVPGRLDAVLTPRIARPSRLIAARTSASSPANSPVNRPVNPPTTREAADVVGSTVVQPPDRHAPTH